MKQNILDGLPQLKLLCLLPLLFLTACSDPYGHLPEKRLMVLGVDGMDYGMTARLMAAGRMPNFSRLSEQGGFSSLGTSVPPLSPVAWSDFMTGLDSGGHGIFDFLHRDPHQLVPEFSMSKSVPPSDHWSIGSWHIPTSGGELHNLRQGEVFWQRLEDHGVVSSIVRMPANYPPVGAGSHELSGMGTPDIHGSYGRFTFITSQFGAGRKSVDGGEIQEVWEEKGVIQASLNGPLNPYKDPTLQELLQLPMEIVPSAEGQAVKITIDDQVIALSVGDWSEWVPVEFTMLPVFADLHGMVRFYLRSTRPHLELYVSPINFDPLNPDTLLSVPADYVEDLAEATGRFYTQGMPEDTKALEEGILNREEFFTQASLAAQDVMAQIDLSVASLLEERRSFLFYYLGHLDQISHMTWKSTDPLHPTYDPETDPYWAAKIEDLYVEIDALVGRLVEQLGDQATLVVMSDHGFAPWRREMDLNAWLLSEGYLVLNNGQQSSGELFQAVDWSKTRAYGLGFNGLYLNLKGREKNGVVTVAERDDLLKEIKQKLLATMDPEYQQPAVTKVYRVDEYYQAMQDAERTPDLVIGYAYGTRSSSAAALGAVGDVTQIFKDHTDEWSGDHSMDHETVPGILLTTEPLQLPASNLRELPVSILRAFDLEPNGP